MTDTTPANPSPTCTDGYRSLEPWWIVKGPGPLAGFELRLDKETYRKGENITAKLHNVSNQKQAAGNGQKYDIQFQAPDGWHTIIGVREDAGFEWTDEGYLIPPGNERTWRLTLTETGIWDGEYHGQSYRACQPLNPGNYRFVFWGVGEPEEALGIRFTVVDD